MKPYFVAEVVETRWGLEPYTILAEYDSLEEAAGYARYMEDNSEKDIEVFYRSGMENLTCVWRECP